MSSAGRVTDEVDFHRRRGDLRSAVQVVRARQPERLRWRSAVAQVSQSAGQLGGMTRLRVEEPVREIVLDLNDRILRRETVLDARRFGVDLDRGEVLPVRTRWDLSRTAYLTGVSQEQLERYVRLPADYGAPIDVAGVVIIARALATAYGERADKLMARIQGTGDSAPGRHVGYMAERVQYERDLARRWAALSRTMIDGAR